MRSMVEGYWRGGGGFRESQGDLCAYPSTRLRLVPLPICDGEDF
jgi:hypothetical protein